MKRKGTKKDFDKFSKRNTHKRRGKDAAKRELLKAVMETGVSLEGARINLISDSGRRARVSSKIRRDEICVRGIFSSSKSGFGFVTPEEGYDKDIFIPEDKTGGAIDGDLVEIIYHIYESRFGERTEGRVKKIISFGRRTVIGTLAKMPRDQRRHKSSYMYTVTPDDVKISLHLVVVDDMGAEVGDKVEVLLDRSSGTRGAVECRVIRNFGNTYTRAANYEAILAEFEIPVDFTQQELLEAEFFSSVPLSDEGRILRDRDVIFTIDGEGAKDLDDAVSLKRLKNGWQLGVHIADVSSYVKERTHLDRAVMSRGTSVYFTDKVVPMLPTALSNGACSLNAGEDKYALSAIINLSSDGAIASVRLEPSIIRSRVRGVYSEVNRIFDKSADKEIISKYKEVIPTLQRMHELYLILKKRSEERGALELESSESEIVLNGSGEPIDIVRRERGDAEMLIEQFMLVANEAVATLLYEKGIPCVYRVHENPPPEKFSEFLTYAHNLGFDTAMISRDKASPKDLSNLLSKAKSKGMGVPVSYVMLRSMAKAKYSEVKNPHFGLGIDCYCHFTSPIRRLSDLATHRIIHKVLIEGKRPEMYASYARRAAAAASEAELRALSAERRIENLYKVIYMDKYIGDEFDAVINSVTSFGFFAELENTCEGLVPISELPGVFMFDEKNMTLRSRDTVYHLGQKVRVRLEEADIIRGKLRFSVV